MEKDQWSIALISWVHSPTKTSESCVSLQISTLCFWLNIELKNDILSVRVACCYEVKTIKIRLKRTPVQSFIHHYLFDKVNGISRVRLVKKQDCVYIFFGILASEFLCFCHFFFNVLIRSTAMNLHKITTRIMLKYFCIHGFYTQYLHPSLKLSLSYYIISSQDAILVSRYLYTCIINVVSCVGRVEIQIEI